MAPSPDAADGSSNRSFWASADIGLADPRVGQRQRRVPAGAAAAVHRPHPEDTAALVGAQPDHRMPSFEAEPVPCDSVDPVAFEKRGAKSYGH